jgi:hypothetical protein
MRIQQIMSLALVVALAPLAAPAVDCGAPGKAKLFDRLALKGKARVNYRSGRADCIQKGPAGSLSQLSGTYEIFYVDNPGSVRGAFVMPQPFLVNKDDKAKYINRNAPLAPGAVKVAGMKLQKLARVGARGLGDSQQLNLLSGPPGPGGMLSIFSIDNAADGQTYRVCTRWSEGLGSILKYELVDGGLGVKLFLKGGVSSSCTVVTTTSTTSSTSTSTSLTSTTSTSSTTLPPPPQVTFTVGPAGGVCGEVRIGGPAGAILKNLTCGGLNIGGGGATVPEGPTPDGAPTRFLSDDCPGDICTLTETPNDGSTGCSDIGCPFGPYLSIANGPLSTCVANNFGSPGSATLDLSTGAFVGAVPLISTTNVTGNNAQPCPPCVAGTCVGGPNNGNACTAINASLDTYDCPPGGEGLVPFPVSLSPLGTGVQVADSGGTGVFCPSQATPGAFGCGNPGNSNVCPAAPLIGDYIEQRGVEAGAISPNTNEPIGLASVFCIPKVGNFLIDGAADLPGPGAITLPGTLRYDP